MKSPPAEADLNLSQKLTVREAWVRIVDFSIGKYGRSIY